MLSGMTIGKKLLIAFGLMFVLTAALAITSLSAIGRLGRDLDVTVNQTAKKLQSVERINDAVSDLRASQRGLILYTLIQEADRVTASKEQFEAGAARIKSLVDEARPLVVTEEGRRALAAVESSFEKWRPVYREILTDCQNERWGAEFNAKVDRTLKFSDEMEEAAGQLIAQQEEFLRASAANAARTTAFSRWTAIVLIALCLGIGVGILFVVQSISKALREVTEEMARGAEQVASASAQVASSSQSLAQGASEQAASLEETSSTSEEVASMTRKNAENTQAAAGVVTQSQAKFDGAVASLDEMVSAMGHINEASEKISRIIKVIDDIAFQTNILALNAAVEAARAGEAGMGFAVVADEVRNLAQRSAQAAKDTSAMIEESVRRSQEGRERVDQVTAAIQSIAEESITIKTLMDEVNASSQEQAHGMEQIASAIVQMEQVTQRAAASAEESASASQEMNAQAEAMRAAVARLREMVGS